MPTAGRLKSNPLRQPDIIQAIRLFIVIEGRGLPGKPSGKVILAMVQEKFKISAGLNQLAGMMVREGLTRGGPVNRGPGSSSEKRLRQIAERGPLSPIPSIDELEADRLRRVESIRAYNLQRHADERARVRQLLELGPDPELIATPINAIEHDIEMARQKITRTPRVSVAAPDPRPNPIRLISPTRECCWPIGDPGTPQFRYCDEPHKNRTYCDDHARIAYGKQPKAEFIVNPLPAIMAGYR